MPIKDATCTFKRNAPSGEHANRKEARTRATDRPILWDSGCFRDRSPAHPPLQKTLALAARLNMHSPAYLGRIRPAHLHCRAPASPRPRKTLSPTPRGVDPGVCFFEPGAHGGVGGGPGAKELEMFGAEVDGA
ncbi:Uncharacterised protein [Corynebacterium renale]|nr:Uncharacterised protein [Corynebacterium renale]